MTQSSKSTREAVLEAVGRALEERRTRVQEDLVSSVSREVAHALEQLAQPPELAVDLFPTAPQSTPTDRETVSLLYLAVNRMVESRDQVSILRNLVQGAQHFAARVAVFVCRDGVAVGWSAAGFAEILSMRDVSLSLEDGSTLGRAATEGRPLSEVDGSAEEIWSALGSEAPDHFLLLPLLIRGRVAAVLLVDAGPAPSTASVHREATSILARMAEMRLATLFLHRAGETADEAVDDSLPQDRPEAETAGASPAPAQEPIVATPPTEVEGVTPSPEPPIEPPHPSPPLASSSLEPSPATPGSEAGAEMGSMDFLDRLVGGPMGGTQVEVPLAAPREEPARAPSPAPPDPGAAPAHEAGPTADHDDARRFARLLISEILLYNQEGVQEGRRNRDLTQRLRKDLERSEQMYLQRVSPEVSRDTDYFREEVIRSLAGGDESLLK